jgi:AcrR family transcriptional regulator
MAERADAARNREAILGAAQRLLRERDLDDICMDDVAAAAGVGKGTVFRRFGDREGLVEAVVNHVGASWREQAERILADAELSAVERVITFVERLFEHILETLPLVRAFEQVSERFRCGDGLEPIRQGLVASIAEARPEGDAEFRAESLLAVLRAQHVHYLLRQRGMSVDQVRAGVIGLAWDLVGDRRGATMPAL